MWFSFQQFTQRQLAKYTQREEYRRLLRREKSSIDRYGHFQLSLTELAFFSEIYETWLVSIHSFVYLDHVLAGRIEISRVSVSKRRVGNGDGSFCETATA
jgi:hypothetical protein